MSWMPWKWADVALFFVADEDVETEVVATLHGLGHEVSHAAEQGRVLTTNGKDLCDLIFRQRRSTCGVILVRVPGTSADVMARLVAQAVGRYGETSSGRSWSSGAKWCA